MRLGEILSKNVETIEYDRQAQDAWNLMRQRRIHHLVVMRGREVVGVLSNRDLGGDRGDSVRRNQIVADLMTTHPLTVETHTTVREAANLMRGRSIGCLPILEKGKLIGIVTISDLLELIGRGSERSAPKGEGPVMKGRGPRHKAVRI